MKTFICVLLLLLFLLPVNATAGDLAVIVHKDNPLSTISMSDLSKIYKGRMTSWPAGGLIVAVNRDLRSKEQETFYEIGVNDRPVEAFVFKFEYQNNRSSGESLERGNNNGYIGSMTAVF